MGRKYEYKYEKYVYDGSREAGAKAFARAHRPWECRLCGEMVKVGSTHWHYNKPPKMREHTSKRRENA